MTSPCGTRARYVAGCHCEPCTQANSDYHRDHRWPVGAGLPHIRQVPPFGAWVEQAACQGHDTAMWFRDQHDESSYRDARAVCAGCPVRLQCLAWALNAGEPHGVWGGLSPKERGRLRRKAAVS